MGSLPRDPVRRGTFPREVWAVAGEDFRSLRTRVRGALRGEVHRIILVTSAVAREGKSTVSVHLARSLAATGLNTLLVDADLRRPDLHLLFGLEQAGGVSEVVRGKLALAEAEAPTDVEHLSVLTAGARSSAPAELIDSPGLPAMLREAAGGHDYVVVDSAPLVSITDTQLLARHADGILFVVRGRVTPREIVRGAFENLQDLPVLGVVLNGISTPRRYGYYY